MKNDNDLSKLNNLLACVLQIGFFIIVTIIGIGIFLLVMRPGPHRPYVLPPLQAIKESLSLRPTPILDIGLLVLLGMPLLLLIITLFSFIRIKEKKFALISCLVLLILALSFLGGRG
ncbi:DUF1634 domain-containing protein [Candidatus Poribacteria bacterium]|nr:DUF1634 domain-containing protein [Candidatus Poribacteria bacterium]